MAASAKANAKSMRDKQRASNLKAAKEERMVGRCAVCYRVIPNDTFGGRGAWNHYPAACCGR